MSDYRIEKVRHRVALTLASGVRLDGDIFLQAFARFKAGPEEPLDALNDPDPFLPLVLLSGDLLLVQKSQIAIAATALPDAEDPVEAGVVRMHIEITFGFGETRTGTIFEEVRADRPRLVDFLNNTTSRFHPVFATDQLLLISTAHIAYARPSS